MSNLIIDTALTLWRTGRKVRTTSKGWLSGNAPCCIHNNQTPDRRGRGGMILAEDKLNFSCFNCGFKTGYQIGSHLTTRFRSLIEWLGADQQIVDKLTIEAVRIREEHIGAHAMLKKFNRPKIISFDTRPLPEDSIPLDCDDPQHQQHVEYLVGRHLDPRAYPYHISPDAKGRDSNRLIIPYYYGGQIVGNTARYYDGRKPKYISDRPRGLVFNLDGQGSDWETCILVEGEFDAISIGGCAYMGSTISDEQVDLLTKLYRKIIVVPDRDITGLTICDRALDLGYHISIPDWDPSIKDVNDAVKQYGRLATTLSILQNATTNKIKLEMMRRKFRNDR